MGEGCVVTTWLYVLCRLYHLLWLLQERTETVEAQLAETTAQLHELKLRQRQLEARNNLLEKVAALNKQQSMEDRLLSSDVAESSSLNMWQVQLFSKRGSRNIWHSVDLSFACCCCLLSVADLVCPHPAKDGIQLTRLAFLQQRPLFHLLNADVGTG